MQSSRVNDNPPWTTDNNGNQLSGVPDWGNGANNTNTSGVSGGPWRCANVIDADNLVPSVGLRAKVMNGVYYNPNITYNPPLGANGKLIKGDTDGSSGRPPTVPPTRFRAHREIPEADRATTTILTLEQTSIPTTAATTRSTPPQIFRFLTVPILARGYTAIRPTPETVPRRLTSLGR